MVKGTPPINVYESRSVPQAAASPFRRAADFGGGIGGALSRAGQAIQNYVETDLQVKRQQAQDDEDAGRIQAAQRMADFRTQVSQMQRDVFENAPNGYENATHTASTNFETLRQQFMSDGLASPQANRFFAEASGLYQPQFLDGVAGQEAQARDQYQVDTARSTIESNANIIFGDPSQYEQISRETAATLGGISNQHAQRELIETARRGYAASAVSSLINRNPGQMLRRLQAAEPDSLIANLGAAEREQAVRSARSEIQRRQAQAQVAVAQGASTAMARWAVGLDAPGAPSFESVYNTAGPQAALNYETARLQGQHTSDLVGMTSAQLAGIAAEANDPQAAARGHELSVGGNRHTGGGDAELRDAISRQARAQAAAAILQERQTDPMQQQVRQGLVPQSDIVGAVRQGDWGMVNGILANRAAAAEQNGTRLGVSPENRVPLTAFEARNVGQALSAMPSQDRAVILRNFAAWTGGGLAYQNMMGQLFPTSPGTAYAGYIAGLGHPAHGNNADIILRGEDLLGGRTPGATGSDASGRRSATPLVSLPPEEKLRAAWATAVGDAYSGWGQSQHPDNQAEEQSYQVFRSAYAALSYDAHDPAPAIPDPARVGRAVTVSTGGIMNWGGHRVLVPPGMMGSEFTSGVRAGFARSEDLRGRDPTGYSLRAIAATARGGGVYLVYNGDNPLIINGRMQTVEVRR